MQAALTAKEAEIAIATKASQGLTAKIDVARKDLDAAKKELSTFRKDLTEAQNKLAKLQKVCPPHY